MTVPLSKPVFRRPTPRLVAAVISMTVALPLTSCATKPAPSSQAERPITYYQRAMIDKVREGMPTDSLEYQILEDYWVTDEEMYNAYDQLVACLTPLNIEAGWDPTFTQTEEGLTYGPNSATQHRLQEGMTDEEEIWKVLDEAKAVYDSCAEGTVASITQFYTEQMASADGRSFYIRLRDAFVDCGYTDLAGLSEMEVEEQWKQGTFMLPERSKCFNAFVESEPL